MASAPMTTPDMHAALARLVNNEMTRKQEKIDPIPRLAASALAATRAMSSAFVRSMVD